MGKYTHITLHTLQGCSLSSSLGLALAAALSQK